MAIWKQPCAFLLARRTLMDWGVGHCQCGDIPVFGGVLRVPCYVVLGRVQRRGVRWDRRPCGVTPPGAPSGVC